MKLVSELYEGSGLTKSPFQALLQLDRYTVKDLDPNNISVGDVVVGTIKTGKYPQKDFGRVIDIVGDDIIFIGENTGEEHRIPKLLASIALDAKWSDAVERMVRGFTSVERNHGTKKKDIRLYAEQVREFLTNEWFVPGGRIQASLGALEMYGKDLQLTPYNCYVLPMPHDSRDGIVDLLKDMVNVMSRGGGVGINLSSLRPALSRVYGVNGTSSGSVSWGGLYSYATGLVEQAGSRRGALMLMLHITHPDVLDFIRVKQESGMIENANLSVQNTIEFMDAVEHNRNWKLIFPDTQHPSYDEKWGSEYKSIHAWLEAGLPVRVHKELPARQLYEEIVGSAWRSAEPGFVVYDRMNYQQCPTQDLVALEEGGDLYVLDPKVREEYASLKQQLTPWNNTWYYQENEATNPCGEQPLSRWAVCNLGHVNLAEMYDENTDDVHWDRLRKVVRTGVRFLDNVIDYAYYFDVRNEEVQKQQRRIGLGTMGLHNLLLHKRLRYGSPQAIEFVDKVYRFIANEAYMASSLLAKEKGAAPLYKKDLLRARLPMLLDENVREHIGQHGLRNTHLLTQAPTGTTGTKTGRHGHSVSTGIEPYFAWRWERMSRVGGVTEDVASHYMKQHDLQELPDFFVSAMCVEDDGTPKITPLQHVAMQAAVQKWNDSAISKTTNVPSGFTVEQTETLYLEAYKQGLVGMTIYRDGSRDEQILTTEKTERARRAERVEETVHPERVFTRRPPRLQGTTFKKDTPLGNALIAVNSFQGEPVEVVLNVGKGGSHTHAMSEALGRMISLFLQYVGGDPAKKLETVVRHLANIGTGDAVGFGPNRIASVPDAVAKALEELRLEMLGIDAEGHHFSSTPAQVSVSHTMVHPIRGDICPECGQASVMRLDGCQQCLEELGGSPTCSFSRC